MKKILTFILMLFMALGMSMTTFAATDVNAPGTAESKVVKTVDSEFSVLVPKKIELTSEKTDFTVQAKGNIAATETLEVTVDETVDMKRAGDDTYDAKDATVTLEGCTWNDTTLTSEYTSYKGSVTFDETKAGEYSGTGTFYINLKSTKTPSASVESTESSDEEAGIYDANGVRIASWEEVVNVYEINVSEDTEISDMMTYSKLGLYLTWPGESIDALFGTSGTVTFADKGATKVIVSDEVAYLGDAAFHSCSSLETAIIPNSVKSIGIGLFAQSGIKSITIPESITVIPDAENTTTDVGRRGCFDYCTNLVEVNLPDTLTYIGSAAFRDCTSLEQIVIPANVTYIGEYAFENCKNLKTIIFEGTQEQWENISFGYEWNNNCPSDLNIVYNAWEGQ